MRIRAVDAYDETPIAGAEVLVCTAAELEQHPRFEEALAGEQDIDQAALLLADGPGRLIGHTNAEGTLEFCPAHGVTD